MRTAIPCATNAAQRRFSDGQGHRRRSLVALTPLIDVVFILLVFFMLASSFLDWRSIEVTVTEPLPESSAVRNPDALLLTVDGTEIRLNGELLPIDAAIDRVQQWLRESPATVVRIRPIDQTPLQPVIEVIDRLKLAGVTAFTISRDHNWQSPSTHGDD